MGADADDIRVRHLTPGESLKLRDAMGHTLVCCTGTIWITQENDLRDIFLSAGESFTFDRPGNALISAEEGMKAGAVTFISLRPLRSWPFLFRQRQAHRLAARQRVLDRQSALQRCARLARRR